MTGEGYPRRALGLTTKQAAEELGISPTTLRHWADRGLIECYRTPGGQRRFNNEQIRRFLDTLARREP
jgi:excisionase family DNA binding protein